MRQGGDCAEEFAGECERATAIKYSGKLGSRESELRRATPARGANLRARSEEKKSAQQMGNLSDHTPVLYLLQHRIHISQIYQIALVDWLRNNKPILSYFKIF